MVPWSSPGDILRWWRSDVLGLSQQQVADLLSVQPTALSNWENGTRAISIDIRHLDNCLRGGGALAGLLWGFGTAAGLEPKRSWCKVFPGESTPYWIWIRSPSKVIRFEAEHGVVRVETHLDLGANGVFLIVGASVAISPIVIHLDEPGWCDFGRGELPAFVPGADTIPAVNLVRRSSATGAFMQLFIGNMNDKVSRNNQRSRELAALAMMAPKTLASFLSGFGRGGDAESPGAWPPASDSDPEAMDRSRFARLRAARGLSLADTSQLLTEVTGVNVGKDTLRRFETDVGQPHHRLLPIALDHVLEANGHLGQVVLRSDRGQGVVRFPEYWRGPVWLAFEGPAVERRINLQWGDWRRTLRTTPPLLTSFVCALPGSPMRIKVEDDIQWTMGLGRRPGALAIDQDWVPASVGGAQHALREAERAFLNAIRAVKPTASR